MADWSKLPCDLLGEVALKLDSIDDFIYFSSVCSSWKNASSTLKRKQYALPWLLLAENNKENPDHLRKIYNLTNNKCYQLSMPETFGGRCWGSSCGWVVVLTRDFKVQLFNPLTKDRITTLPSTENLPHAPFDPTNIDDSYNYWMNHVFKLAVFKIPQSNDLLVAAIYDEPSYHLAVAQPGDQAWTYIDKYAEDVVCCGDLIYFVACTGRTRYCDIKGICGLKYVKVMNYAHAFRTDMLYSDRNYLQNLGDEPFLLVRKKNIVEARSDDVNPLAYDVNTIEFEVYRVDSKSKKWVKTEDLGDFSLFVRYSSMCIHASMFNNFKRNCIYFADDDDDQWFSAGIGGKDMGVFDMKTGGVTKFYEGDDTLSRYCPPFFFVPNY